MQYLGLDVHVKATVWHLLDSAGQTVEMGKTPTSIPDLQKLVRRFSESDQLLVGQEVGKMAYLVHDLVTATGVKILSFNAWHLRMIASSRKKTDRRDAYWIAKALQTGMTPTPVYLPTGEVRELRNLISRREAIVAERTRWLVRARSYLQAAWNTHSRACSDRCTVARESQGERSSQTIVDHSRSGRTCGTDDLRLGWRRDALSQRARPCIVCGPGAIGKSDWRIRNTWQNYTYGLDTASQHVGTIGPCASVSMPIRTVSPVGCKYLIERNLRVLMCYRLPSLSGSI